jgi:hypothetical protein
MRALLHSTLAGHAALTDIVGDRIYHSSALGVGGVPAQPKQPYVVYHELSNGTYPEVRETSRAGSHIFQITVYDERGSFIRIDQALQAVRETVSGLPGTVSPSGARCLDAEWQGTSEDISDEEYDSNVKYATLRMTADR